MIYFVGAGPGAVDLITVRGLRLIREADVIIYAGSLINTELLREAKEGCQTYNSAYMTLEEVLAVMEEAEKENKKTVRLHTGDPSLYGAIREQIEELKKRCILYEICPGVSSMAGAAAALGVEYTLPGVTQSVMISRAAGRTPVPEKERLRELAKHQTTMILFLSSGLAKDVQEELLTGGRAPDTPVAVVYKATWEEEIIVWTKLSSLAEKMEKEGIKKTALIIVGEVLGGNYEKSKLYDKNFSTEFRKGKETAERGD